MRFSVLGIGIILGAAIQATWLANINLPGMVKPDLIFVMVISYGLLRGPDEGTLFGLIAGFFLDLLSGGVIGIGALIKMVAGFSAGLMEKVIFKDNLLIPAIAAFFGTIIFELLNLLMHLSFKSHFNFGYTLLYSILPLAVYNTLVAPVIYHFLLKLEHFLLERNNSM